jgi:hypothetical protein
VRTPAFVDRMDVADDAEGRVAIFSVDGRPDADPPGEPLRVQRGSFRRATDRLGVWLDNPYAGAAIAAVLVLILVLGLLLSRH